MKNIRDRLYVATFEDDAQAVAAEYGLGLELNHICISQTLDGDRKELLSEMRRDAAFSALTPILHGPFTEIYPAAIDPLAREFARQRLQQAYEVCSALGVSRMVVHSGWLPFIYFKSWQAEKSAAFWQDFTADKPPEFELLIENVLEDEPLMLAEMMKHTEDPRIRLCLDVGHANAMAAEGFPIGRWLAELAPFIGHFHLHNNYGREDSHGSFSDGSLNMDEVLRSALALCPGETTFTIEATDCRACARWLADRGYI